MENYSQLMTTIGKQAKDASESLRLLPTKQKNTALQAMADALRQQKENILSANQADIRQAKAQGLRPALIERLTLNAERIENMANGIEKIKRLADPMTEIDKEWISEDGLHIERRRVPLGVVGIIYESRPNVTADASALCLKSGNATILRGGKEALRSNLAIETALKAGLAAASVSEDAIQVIPDTDRRYSNELMTMTDYVDLLIPRGGHGLIQAVKQNASVPVIETAEGNCHLYIENSADVQMASDILFNGKTQRPSVCNALESLVIDYDIAKAHLGDFAKRLQAAGVNIRGDEETLKLVEGAELADTSDYATEFLDLIISVKVVSGYDEAIKHISHYSTHHSDAIVTNDYSKAEAFLNDIDSAAVYVNASTRFTDGEMFGFGGEIGISTQKFHARGPMGLEALTSYKYAIEGKGQIRK